MESQYFEMDEMTMDIPDSQSDEKAAIDQAIEQAIREKYKKYLTA